MIGIARRRARIEIAPSFQIRHGVDARFSAGVIHGMRLSRMTVTDAA
ncbi:hypothetical protein [Burkholderia metallica]